MLRMGRAMVDLLRVASPRFPNGSRWTSTTRSMRSTVVSSCGCSTPTTTNTDFSRSSCSTTKAASSRFVLRPAKRPSGKEIKPFLRRLLRDPRLTISHRDPAAGHRQPLLRSRGSRLVSRQWPRLPASSASRQPRRVRRHVEGLESQHEGEIRGRAANGEASSFHGVRFDGAQSWSRVERIIARVEAGAEGPDTRFVVTNLRKLATLAGSPGMSIAGAAMPKTISSPGRPIWRRIARPAPGRQPTSFGCSCMRAPTG